MSVNVVPTGLARDLLEREQSGKPIRIGLVGSGEMGTDIVTRVKMMDGVEIAAIADIEPARAHEAVSIAHGATTHSADASSTNQINSVIESGRTAVTSSDILFQSGLIDVVVDATGVPAVGAEIGLNAMEHGKHLVMMNVEADVTIGAYLRSQADRLGVIYSLGAGDEPSACMEIIEFVTAMGHNVVCAGKGKNNPLNINAVPADYEEEAKARNMNPRMLVEFVDGSKTMVEMSAIANATGLIPEIDGMHGPAASPKELASTLIPKKDGGVLSGAGRVDYSVGAGLAPGVFVVCEAQHPRIHERMTDLKMGEGPYFSFIRPYHLTSLEVPLTCARAVLYGKADMAPLAKPTAEVAAVAKRELVVGETLDALGEYTYRAHAMEAGRARRLGARPSGLLVGATVTAPISKGELITCDNSKLPRGSKIAEMRARQDRMIFEESNT